MVNWSKAKNALEWMQLAKFVGDCMVAAGSWRAIKAMLAYIPGISQDWILAISYLCAGFILLGIVWWQQRSRSSLQIQTQTQAPENNSLAAVTVRDKVLQFGHDLFSFLREKGPEPTEPLNHLRSSDDIWYASLKKWGPYVEGIHYGYLARFQQRAVDLFNDLSEHHIHFDLEPWEIDPPQAVREKYVRRVAEECFLIAARLDIGEESKGT